jgi:NAD+ diphosphatase
MENLNEYMRFIPHIKPLNENCEEDLWFVFKGDKMMVKKIDEKIEFPNAKDVNSLELRDTHCIGTLDNKNCFCSVVDEECDIKQDLEFEALRNISMHLEKELFSVCARAFSVILWDRNNKFCGKCGSSTENKIEERAKVCPRCGSIIYPRISPAVIMAIVKENEILLAHNKNFQGNMYSVLAGFVDAGEAFEQCVKREVYEEVGIKVKNIKYFNSQPWPFPDSLMVGFTAEYDSGVIEADGIEIEMAGWFSKDNLPTIPKKGTIARELIEWFIENH